MLELAFPSSAQVSGALSAAIKEYMPNLLPSSTASACTPPPLLLPKCIRSTLAQHHSLTHGSLPCNSYTQTRARTYRDFEANYYPPRPAACTGVSWTDPLETAARSNQLHSSNFAFPIFIWGLCAALSFGLSCLVAVGLVAPCPERAVEEADGFKKNLVSSKHLGNTDGSSTATHVDEAHLLRKMATAVAEQAEAQQQLVRDLATISSQMQKRGNLIPETKGTPETDDAMSA